MNIHVILNGDRGGKNLGDCKRENLRCPQNDKTKVF